MRELEDLTPISASESWDTWLVLTRVNCLRYTWHAWIDMWAETSLKYWEYRDSIRKANRES